MINENPIEILDLPNHLRSLFIEKVPEANPNNGNAERYVLNVIL